MSVDLSQIHPRAFAHPADLKATQALRSVPFLAELRKTIARLNVEEKFRSYQMYNSTRISSTQLPSLYRMINEVAERLGMAEPTAYVSSEGGVNAFAFGLNRHSIILTSELVDLMNDRELEAIIAHELAHIMCEHMLYRDVALALTNQALFPFKLSSLTPARMIKDVTEMTISTLLLSWYRAAEYTADRAALLILDDAEAVAACLGRLAGVPQRFISEFDPQVFAEQLRNYEEEAPKWSKFVTWGMGAFRSHPEPVKRAAAILEWAKSKEYEDIRNGTYVTRFEVAMTEDQIEIDGVAACVLCGAPVGDNPVCSECEMIQDPRYHVACEKGHLNSTTWKFCKTCGGSLG